MPWMILFRIGMMLGTVALVGGLYWHYTNTIAENKRLTTELYTANSTIIALDTLVEKQNQIRANERTLIDEIEKTPAEQDGPTAVVLFDAIGRLHAKP